jgi:hypothetical protein
VPCLFREHNEKEKMILEYIFSTAINGILPPCQEEDAFFKFMNKGGFLSNNSKKGIENQNRGGYQ